ncbi:MAG: DoxX family membrane protein [Sciscionella sp.]|nr:DoxX family membrane protein [Sciscionella sp.]
MDRPPKTLDAIGTVVRLGLAAVWLFAGVPKLTDLNQNYLAVRDYRLFNDATASVVSAAQPILEIALGVLLVLGIGIRVTGALSALLLLIYIAGITQAWARGLHIDCGCFSRGGTVAPDQTTYPADIARDVGFLALALWLTVRPHTLLSLDAVLLRDGRGAQ